MNKYIAYCGLDCKNCEARIATINNDDSMRKEIAKKWSELNKIEITPDQINCEGCRMNGVKTVFCDSLCQIRQCALKLKRETCGDCNNLNTCNKVKKIIGNNKEAYNRLININDKH